MLLTKAVTTRAITAAPRVKRLKIFVMSVPSLACKGADQLTLWRAVVKHLTKSRTLIHVRSCTGISISSQSCYSCAANMNTCSENSACMNAQSESFQACAAKKDSRIPFGPRSATTAAVLAALARAEVVTWSLGAALGSEPETQHSPRPNEFL